MDAAAGDIVWRQFVVDVGTTENAGYLWGSPLICNDTISIGISSACDNPLIRGGLKSFHLHTGMPLRVYWPTPNGTVGASVWTSTASDGRSIWITVGGDAVDSFSIVRLSSTLKFKSKWTVPDIAGTDLDWGSSPTLFEAKIDGSRTQMVGANEKYTCSMHRTARFSRAMTTYPPSLPNPSSPTHIFLSQPRAASGPPTARRGSGNPPPG